MAATRRRTRAFRIQQEEAHRQKPAGKKKSRTEVYQRAKRNSTKAQLRDVGAWQ